MAQTGFPLGLNGESITILNDSGTTAITAGDIVASIACDDKFTGTAATARSSYAAGDIRGKSALLANTYYKTVIGVALQDIPADGYGSIALEGVFLHPVDANVEAGENVMFNISTGNKLAPITDLGTTAVLGDGNYIIGKALTGGSADGKYIAWKLTL